MNQVDNSAECFLCKRKRSFAVNFSALNTIQFDKNPFRTLFLSSSSLGFFFVNVTSKKVSKLCIVYLKPRIIAAFKPRTYAFFMSYICHKECLKVVYRSCVRKLCAKVVFRSCVQKLWAEVVYRNCVQKLCAKNECKSCVQKLCVEVVYRSCEQKLCAKAVCKSCVQRLCTEVV